MDFIFANKKCLKTIKYLQNVFRLPTSPGEYSVVLTYTQIVDSESRAIHLPTVYYIIFILTYQLIYLTV